MPRQSSSYSVFVVETMRFSISLILLIFRVLAIVESARGDAQRMIRKFLACLLLVYPLVLYGSVTVDLVCSGTTRIILNGQEQTRESWSTTISLKNGFQYYDTPRPIKWDVSERLLSYSEPGFIPLGDYAYLYDRIEKTIEINRISGKITQRWVFSISEKMIPVLGRLRYQLDEGFCKPGQRKF